jgi:hypothetical protein
VIEIRPIKTDEASKTLRMRNSLVQLVDEA